MQAKSADKLVKKTPKQLRKEGAALIKEGQRKIAKADKDEGIAAEPKIPDADPEAQALARLRYERQESLASLATKKEIEDHERE